MRTTIAALTACLAAMASIQDTAAQSPGGFALDPNAETNQVPAPSNSQPANPGAASYPSSRVPTDPSKLRENELPGRFILPRRVVPAPVPPDAMR